MNLGNASESARIDWVTGEPIMTRHLSKLYVTPLRTLIFGIFYGASRL